MEFTISEVVKTVLLAGVLVVAIMIIVLLATGGSSLISRLFGS